MRTFKLLKSCLRSSDSAGGTIKTEVGDINGVVPIGPSFSGSGKIASAKYNEIFGGRISRRPSQV